MCSSNERATKVSLKDMLLQSPFRATGSQRLSIAGVLKKTSAVRKDPLHLAPEFARDELTELLLAAGAATAASSGVYGEWRYGREIVGKGGVCILLPTRGIRRLRWGLG